MSSTVQQSDELKLIQNTVRGIPMTFVGYTRALELCARMNYEVENLDFIDKIPAGSVLYDLGACEGRFALYAALRGIKVFAFEPENRNFEAMLRNLEQNPEAKENFTPLQLAIGARNGKSTLKIAQPWAGGHQKVVSDAPSRVDLYDFAFSEEQEIEIVSLDSFVAESGHPAPDYLKIDVDGSEKPFLLGATKTVATEKLKAIIFELSERDPSYTEIVESLQKAGLKLRSRHEIPNEPQLYNIIFER